MLCLGGADDVWGQNWSNIDGSGEVAFAAPKILHIRYSVRWLDPQSLTEPVRLYLVLPDSTRYLLYIAAGGDPGLASGSNIYNDPAPGAYQVLFECKTASSTSTYVLDTHTHALDQVSGSPVRNETLSEWPTEVVAFNVTLEAGRRLDVGSPLFSTNLALAVGGSGTFVLRNVDRIESLTASASAIEIRNATVRMCNLAATDSIALDTCLFQTLSAESDASVTLSGCDVLSHASFVCPAAGLSLMDNVFEDLRFILPGAADGVEVTLAGSSVLGRSLIAFASQAIGAPRVRITAAGCYWGAYNGYGGGRWLDGGRNGYSAWFDVHPDSGFVHSGPENASGLANPWQGNPKILCYAYRRGQNVLGSNTSIRKGRDILFAFDVELDRGERSASTLRMKIGSQIIPPANTIMLKRDYGKPRSDEGNADRTVNFIVPAREDDAFSWILYDEELGGESAPISSGGVTQRPRFARPLRLGVLPLHIEGKKLYESAAGARTVAILQRQMPGILPLHSDELDVVLLPTATFKLGTTAMFAMLSSTWLMHEVAAAAQGYLAKVNATRPTEPLDAVVVLMPRDLMPAPGANLWHCRGTILVNETFPEAAAHEFGHTLGLYTSREQYSALWAGEDAHGNYIVPGYGARVEAVTIYTPGDAAPISPNGNRIRHFPYGLDAKVYDVMGGDGEQWIVPSTFEAMFTGLYTLLGAAAPAPGAASAPHAGPPVAVAPAAGTRRVLVEGTTVDYFRIVRETLRLSEAPDDCGAIEGAAMILGHTFRAYDAAGNEVFSRNCMSHGIEGDLQGWTQTFDVPDTAVRYEISDNFPDPDDIICIHRPVAGKNLVFTGPPAGSLADDIVFQWTAVGAPPSGYAMTLHLSAQRNGGAWTYLGSYDASLNGVTVNSAFLEAGSVSFKAVLSDGFSRVERTLGPYTKGPMPLEVTIRQPSDGAQAPEGFRWTLSGTVYPHEPGITNLWLSSLDGALGDQIELTDMVLSPGDHTLTFVAGRPGEAAVHRTVRVAVVADPATIDLSLDSNALAVRVPGTDPTAGHPFQPQRDRAFSVLVTVQNPATSHTARLQVFHQPPGGAEENVADETFTWERGETHTVSAELPGAGQGDRRLRGVISLVGPPGLSETNLANNTWTWTFTNSPPQAEAGRGITAGTNALSIALRGFDADGDALTYTVTRPPPHGALTGTPPALTYIGTGGSATEDSFGFRISDGALLSAEADFVIRIIPPLPDITGSLSYSTRQYDPFYYRIEATGGCTRYTAPWLTGAYWAGLTLNEATGLITGTHNKVISGNWLVGAENVAGRDNEYLRLTVALNDDPPRVTSALSSDAASGSWFTYQITAANRPTGFLAADLPPALNYSAANGQVSGQLKRAGVYAARIGASNAFGEDWRTLTLRVLPVALPPSMSSFQSAFATAGQPFSYAIDCLHDPYRFESTALPVGLALDPATGVISGTPVAGGTYWVTITAINLYGTAQATFNLTVSTGAGAPIPTPETELYAFAGANFAYTVPVSGGAASAFAAIGLPPGLTIHPTSGIISGKPGDMGRHSVFITASNTEGTGGAKTTIEVNMGADWPAIYSARQVSGLLGDAFTYRILAYNSPTRLLAAPLPPGLTFLPATGDITGRLERVGVHAIGLEAENATGLERETLTLTVIPDYDGWARLMGLSGADAHPLADPDEDRLPNLIEYSANLDARSAGHCMPYWLEFRHGRLHFTYRAWRPPATSSPHWTDTFTAGGLVYRLETSPTLYPAAGWTRTPTFFDPRIELESNSDGSVTVSSPLLAGPEDAAYFFRLGVGFEK